MGHIFEAFSEYLNFIDKSGLIFTHCSKRQNRLEIFSNFVAFSQCLDFSMKFQQNCLSCLHGNIVFLTSWHIQKPSLSNLNLIFRQKIFFKLVKLTFHDHSHPNIGSIVPFKLNSRVVFSWNLQV